MHAIFGFDVPAHELILRGSLVYWLLFLLFRFVLRRDAGALGVADILLLVLIADASQNAMSGGYTSVAEGSVLVATIASWNWLLDWASFRFEAVRRLVEPRPLVLVRRGRMIVRNMRREYISTPELLSALRERGIDKLRDVRMARMEADGQISVIREPPGEDSDGHRRHTPGGP